MLQISMTPSVREAEACSAPFKVMPLHSSEVEALSVFSDLERARKCLCLALSFRLHAHLSVRRNFSRLGQRLAFDFPGHTCNKRKYRAGQSLRPFEVWRACVP